MQWGNACPLWCALTVCSKLAIFQDLALDVNARSHTNFRGMRNGIYTHENF